MSRYLIALTFAPGYLQYQRLDQYRKRFCQRPISSQIQLHLGLIPPFNADEHLLKKELIDLSEDLHDAMDGIEDGGHVLLSSPDLSHNQRPMISLKATLSDDLYHLQETLIDHLKECQVEFKRSKLETKIFAKNSRLKLVDDQALDTILILARFGQNHIIINDALELAKSQFQNPFIIFADTITLFEKINGSWREIPWEAAYDEVANKIVEMNMKYGQDSIAVYQGNPSVHNLGTMLTANPFFKALKTKNN